jgi:hypothetical protein
MSWSHCNKRKAHMNFRTLLRGISALALAALLSGCGGGGSGDDVGPPPPLQTAALAVTVIDTQGRFVDGATLSVASTGASATTATNERATVNVPVDSEQLLRVTKAGFAEQVQLVTVGSGGAALTAMLVAREPAVTIAAIENGGSASGKHGIKVEFPPGALVNAQGQPVSGTIEMLMTPLDTSTSDVAAFPGAFEGTASGVPRSPILTFGTAELVPQQNGQKLQLASGKTAVVELPLYATALQDGTPIRIGDSIALWSLDTTSGLWRQELQGTVIEQPASPTGRAVRATIGHFSWWNLDAFAQRATVNLTVAAPSGVTVPPGTIATIAAQVVAGNGPTGRATTSVEVGSTRSLNVAAPGSVRFEVRFDTPTHVCSGSATAGVSNGQTVNLTVTPSCSALAVPTIVQPATQALSNGRDPLRVQVIVDGPVPDRVELLVDGQQVAQFGPQFFYVHLLDTTALTEGSHQLVARATQGSNGRNSAPVTLIVDRTPPQVQSVTPAPGTDVTRATTFTVTFDEPVSPLPFALADAVKLTVTPPGQSTPTPLAANMALDASGTTLTVTPNADITTGIVGLSWGGLRDAAGNAVTGTVAATWPVARAHVAAPDLPSNLADGFFATGVVSAVIRADGTLLALHKPLPANDVRLARYDAPSNTWVALGPPANDRAVPIGLALAVMALDANDVPVAAFAQSRASDPTLAELVMKRLVNGAWEALAPPLPLAGTRLSDASSGELVFDAQGRPVVAFADLDLRRLQVLRLENGALVSITGGRFSQGAHAITLRTAADGALWLSYLQGFFGSNAQELRVARFDGAWSDLPIVDATPNATQSISTPRLALFGNEPWIAYDRFDGFSTNTRVLRFDGSAWTPVALPAQPDQGNGALDLAVIGGQPVLASFRQDGTTLVIRHDGIGWVDPFSFRLGSPFGQPTYRLVSRGDTTLLVSSERGSNLARFQRLTVR